MHASVPLTVLDIGVRGGPHPRWLPLNQEVQIFGVDADAAECARLSALPSPVPVRYLPYALGAAAGTATLHITRQPGCTSLLEPDPRFVANFPIAWMFEVVRTAPVTLTTLDTLCAREGVSPDVIKIDTQGTELDILRGGENALRHAFLVETEVEFNPVYKNQPLFGEMDAYMRTHGFGLLGLRRDYWRRSDTGPSSGGGTLAHGDALFYRLDVPEARRPLFARALTAYGQHDFVQALGYSFPDAAGRPPLLQRLLGRALGEWKLHRELRGWIDRVRPAGALDWHDPDYF